MASKRQNVAKFEGETPSLPGISHRKLDQAQLACDELERRFPNIIDCLDRRAAHHAQTHDGFDPEIADSLLASANRIDPRSDKRGT